MKFKAGMRVRLNQDIHEAGRDFLGNKDELVDIIGPCRLHGWTVKSSYGFDFCVRESEIEPVEEIETPPDLRPPCGHCGEGADDSIISMFGDKEVRVPLCDECADRIRSGIKEG
jgi:hypothetical protein